MSEFKTELESQLQSRFLTLGKTVLLIAILVAVGVFSAIIGIRLAVRGDEVQVPAITGKTVDEAKSALSRVKVLLEVTGQRYDPAVAAGRVISQLPAAGGRVKENRPVQVIVSLGARRNPVPELTGSSVRSARLMVLESGYELGNVSTISLAGSSREEVIQQHPTAQSREVGSPKIDLLVNRPKPVRFVMPDLTGRNIAVVTDFLEKNGFKVRPPVYRVYQNADKGMVVKQYPEPGYMVGLGDPIGLEVAR